MKWIEEKLEYFIASHSHKSTIHIINDEEDVGEKKRIAMQTKREIQIQSQMCKL